MSIVKKISTLLLKSYNDILKIKELIHENIIDVSKIFRKLGDGYGSRTGLAT